MKIKTKLNFGVGLLFLMIILLVALSSWYVNQLKKDTNNILVANYKTLEYSRNMLLSIEDISDQNSLKIFQRNLDKQKLNITEIGEKEATELIDRHFSILKQNPQDSALISSIRKDIAEVMRLNMEAIERKNNIADNTAEQAILWVSVAGTLCFIIAFILLVNLPSNIANPIKELTESIKQIANQNYKMRVNFEEHNEFGELAKSFNTMAIKLEEYSESKLDKILKGKQRIETLIDNMHDPVIGIDESKKVLFVNAEAEKITGIKKENFVGKQIQDVAVTNDLVRDILKEMILPESKESTMKIYADKKESYFEKEIVDINIIPTGESESKFIGQVIMLRNITPFKELDIAKTNFLGTVSHEFKTPISSIQMGIQLLENAKTGNLNPEQKDLVTGIKEDAYRLLKITSELLNVTQVESGSIQLKMTSTEIDKIVEYALKANKSSAELKQIKIVFDKEKNLDFVFADHDKTAWVLTNLLSNAIRYSHENGEIKIKVYKENEKVYFSVKDFGQGIESRYFDKIFDRYFRIPGTKKEGTGLGLSISKEFIEAQGGEINVQSDLGAGSQFSFSLKLVNSDTC